MQKKWVEAQQLYEEVLKKYSKTVAAPEAVYWRGVCRTRATNDHTVFAEVVKALKEQYPNSVWNKKAIPWAGQREAKKLLPLDSAGRLRSNIVNNAVDPVHLVHDAAGNLLQDFVRQRRPVGRHAVFRVNGADRAGIRVGSLIAHDADRHHGQQDGERLPDLRVETRSPDFVDHDVIGFLENRDSRRSDLTQNSNGKTGSGKWLALQDLFRHSHFAANAPDFIFE